MIYYWCAEQRLHWVGPGMAKQRLGDEVRWFAKAVAAASVWFCYQRQASFSPMLHHEVLDYSNYDFRLR